MSVERQRRSGNPSREDSAGPGPGILRSSSGDPRPLVSQRAALIILAALTVGIVAGTVTYLGSSHTASAVLAGGAACGGTLALLHRLIG